MIKLYRADETDFTHNGIGILDKHIYDATVAEELNGLFAFTFSYPLFAPYGIDINGMSIVKVPTPDGDQLFRVVHSRPSMGELTVQCYHIFYDLTENLIEDIFIQTTNGNGAMSRISSGCQYKHPFTFYSDSTTIASARIVRKNPVEALLDSDLDNSFINRWGGELQRDNFVVKMLQYRGTDRGVVIQHKKDLLGYEGNIDWKSPITRIMPQGFNGLLLPEKYVDSQDINKYPHPKIRVIEFKDIKAAIGENVDDEDAVPLEKAYKKLRQAAKEMFMIHKVDRPKATYKVEFQELSQTEEYKDYAILQRVYLGDTVTVEHKEDNLDIQAKAISYKYDPIKKEYIEITLGNFKESFTNMVSKLDQMQDEISKVSEMPNSILNAAKENATKLINSGFGGNVRIYPERILIMDTKDEMTAKKVWQWNINGLGYSSKGINGPYETAITNDGRIVADFITTGTLTGNLVRGGEVTGSTLRTDDGWNYVHIQKQFIRLMESDLCRVYLGYYKDRTSQVQPTVVLGGDSDFQDGSVVLSKQPTQGFLGIINGKDSNGEPYFVSSVMFRRSGDLILKGGMNGTVTVNSGKGINNYANGGSYWVEATGGIGLKGGNKNVLIDSQTAIVFSIKDKNMLDVVDYNGDTDLRFQTLTLRNGASSYAGKLQVKSGAGTSFAPVMASNFETSSQRKYKTNIRDVQFNALEKIMALNIQQYNLKTDMEQLYEMRMNRQEDDDTVLTTKDITTRYGWIADDENNPECFVTKERNAAEIYSSLAVLIQAFQDEKHAKDNEIQALKEENKKMNHRIEALEQLLLQN
ncbi:phage tail protein [Bacillus sp. WL1]|uniref:phage tail spike protein n=1 Tax=Bacillus sp. WL1 TaxID=2822693 RepID=UPI001B345251|nr:phage tail spike protein [Bacillus sp. WL1]MBP3967739.1 phage tail protein [Bacillus sp. WL1]